VELVSAYIARVQEVNPSLNAVVEDRFEAALQDARLADQFIAKASSEFDRVALYTKYPILGIPFTVKESCGLKGELTRIIKSFFWKTKITIYFVNYQPVF